MGSISAPTAILGAGALAGGSSALSGILGSGAAQQAASDQEQAALAGIHLQSAMFNRINRQLGPYRQAGDVDLAALQRRLPGLLAQPKLDLKTLEDFPGYRFALNQGLQATQNSYAAQGLGTSGPAMKGATNYAEGLASTTYQQAWQDIMAGKQQQYNMLSGVVGTGETAAGQGAVIGQQTAASEANLLGTAGAAAAAGTIGSANSIISGISGTTGAAGTTALMLALNNAGMFSPAQTSSPDYGGSIYEGNYSG